MKTREEIKNWLVQQYWYEEFVENIKKENSDLICKNILNGELKQNTIHSFDFTIDDEEDDDTFYQIWCERNDDFLKWYYSEECTFCNNSGDHRYTFSDSDIKYFINLFGNSFLRIGLEDRNGINFKKFPNVQNIEIEYCPFCGRKLKN